MKGALQKHRTVSITSSLNRQASRPASSDTKNEDNESVYDITSNRSNLSSAKKKVEFSLFDGAYDEKEAHESFQQALHEWRNPSKTSGKNSVTREVSMCKDAGVETQTSRMEQIQDLEDKIKSHSLSYGERMLLLKYRRNDLANTYTPRNESANDLEKYSIETQSFETAIQHHLDFNCIISALDDGKNSQDHDDYLDASTDLRPVNNLNFNEITNNNVTFEEIETPSEINKFDLKLNLEPDFKENSCELKIKESKKPKSERESARNARPKSSRPKSVLKFEQNLNREPSDLLKSIAQRTTDNRVYDDAEFLLMDVGHKEIKPSAQNKPKTAKTTSRPHTARIDPKLYAMSPRSWNPQKSVARQENIRSS